MNRSFIKQRMSLKSSSRSGGGSSGLMTSETKRAAKTISCMRNGKVGPIGGGGPSAAAAAAVKASEPSDDELAALALKQEPEDAYYDEGELLQQAADEEDEEEESSESAGGAPAGQHRASYPTMLTRVRSHSRSLRAMANPSAVWAHFDLCSNDPLRAQCRICGAVVVRGGANPRQCGTTNLHRHLRVHHGGRLIGRRYHVMNDKRDHSHDQLHTNKAIRIATQNLVRQMRQIAPAPSASSSTGQQQQQQQQQQPQQQSQSQQPQTNAQRQAQQIQQTIQAAQQQQQQQQLQQQQQSQQPPLLQAKPTKTLVLKTIPLKVKQIAPTTIKMPPHAVRHSLQNLQQMPQTILPQPPTEVCLRWNSYHSNMQHSFPSLLDSEQFVDVTLACEGRSLKCHKMILSACSDYLAQLLRENPCQHPIILMRDLKFWEVEALVKFMYRGEVNVTHDKLPQLLNAAEALQVKGLAGPSNTQNPKPPMLIPQTKSGMQHSPMNRVLNETKDKPSTSSASTGSSKSNSGLPGVGSGVHNSSSNQRISSPKRGQKRRNVTSAETPDARPFTKIRLQRPTSPTGKQQHREATESGKASAGISSPTVKVEPFERPLSPGDHLYQTHMRDDEDSSDAPTFESIIRMQQDDDPGGEDAEAADAGSDYDNDGEEEHMEFVPTDFLEQEQNLVEDSEDQNRHNANYTDEDSKQNNEEDDEEEEDEEGDEEEQDVAEEKCEENTRLKRTEKDKDKDKT